MTIRPDHPLLAEFDATVVPHCTSPACPFNELCPTVRQVGIADLFRQGRYQALTDCLWWEKQAALTRELLGIEPPATAAALLEALGHARDPRPANAGDAYEGPA